MFEPTEYQLLDFGDHEKLESFGGVIVRRQTPSATGKRGRQTRWGEAEVEYVHHNQRLRWQGQPPERWQVRFQNRKFELRLTPTGQLGIFPEQATNWDWISQCTNDLSGAKALNLFGYTGGTTLALADRGAEIVHVDAAKSVVNWARANAKLSGMEKACIRWIVEDALKFVRRELNRGNRYDIVVADPPSFGRGPGGETWKIQRDLPTLLQLLGELTSGRCELVLISCHTPGFEHVKLKSLVEDCFPIDVGAMEHFEMSITASNGRRLPSGSCVRWFKP